ncbi:hypothetical protein HNP82_002337 [Catenibacillus scindens]|uniref:Uncharacterized protein n=1 Tax=Catenibacillus scindens TaxID=673271 RepID=A0A7W8HB90_9FIRM|nr:hypothetical protein [Catenibacillus scindens]
MELRGCRGLGPLCILFVIFTALITNGTGCFARGLAGCLTFTAATFDHCIL